MNVGIYLGSHNMSYATGQFSITLGTKRVCSLPDFCCLWLCIEGYDTRE